MMTLLLLACENPPADDTDTADTQDTADTADSGETGDTDTGDTDTDTAPAVALSIGLPLYIAPNGMWDTVAASGSAVGVLVVNPDDGPGAASDASYAAAIATMQGLGVKVLGYVPTDGGAVSSVTLQDQISDWFAWYAVDGIFLDEGPEYARCEDARKTYLAVATFIRERDADATVAINTAGDACETYMDFTDVLVTFQGQGQKYMQWSAQSWTASYDSTRFWSLIYDSSPTILSAVLDRARAQNVTYVYVTDDVLPDPWDSLPAYWGDLVLGVP